MVEYMNGGGSGFQQFMAAKDAQKKPGSVNWFVWVLIAVLAGWLVSSWMSPKKEQTANSKGQTNAAQSETAAAVSMPAQILAGDAVAARVAGLRISDIELKKYPADKADGAQSNVAMLSAPGEFLEVGLVGAGTGFPTEATLWKINRAMSGNPIHMYWQSPEGVEFRRSVSISGDYVIEVRDEVANKGKTPVSVGQYARIVRAAAAKSAMVGIETGGIARANGDMERENWKALSKKPYSYQTADGFVGFTDQYWQTIVRIASPDDSAQSLRMRQRSDGLYQADGAAESRTIAPGAESVWTSVIFAGPKNQADLAAAAAAVPGIDQTIDYGWFWFLARPFLWALNALHGLTGNYGVAIIILTIILRALMWPLTKKSFSSMSAMQSMQPEMQRIQKLYANDKARMQAEMLNLYRTHKTSPMGGCLPMILQIPIFFALYKALVVSVPMRQAGFLWIGDLAVMDPYFILPVLMGATMWWQQRLQTRNTAAGADQNNPIAQTQKMMKWMPLIFMAMFVWMPAGLVLYWTVSNLFGIGQMWVIRRNRNS